MNEHDAFATVARALPDVTPTVATVREGAAAVLAVRAETELIVILSAADGWRVPSMLSSSAMPDNRSRRDTSDHEEPLAAMRFVQSSPGSAASRPEDGWLAVTGIAASDVVSVTVASSVDEHTARVHEDGRVLALIQAAWGEEPRGYVETHDGRRMVLS